MNQNITLQEILLAAEAKAGSRWEMMPDALAQNIQEEFRSNGFPVNALYQTDNGESFFMVYFLTANEGPIYTALCLKPGTDDEQSDGIGAWHNGVPVRRYDTIWMWLQNEFNPIIELVRTIAYKRYITAWENENTDPTQAYARYADTVLKTCFWPAHNPIIPSFEEWCTETGWGTGHHPQDMDSFIRHEYLHDYEEWNVFPMAWMEDVRRTDLEINLQTALLADNDDEFI